MITNVKPPVWMPDKRQWLIEYAVADIIDGRNIKYYQRVWCEALVSAENYIALIKQHIRG